MNLAPDPALLPNTFGLPARARQRVRLDTVDQLQALIESGRLAGAPRLILGGGSNLLLGEDIEGWVLEVGFRGRTLVGENEDGWLIRAAAGEGWHDFVMWTLAQGWPGLENLALIPGTVGAAPVQNIGAYGLEVAERIAWVHALSLEDGQCRDFSAEACGFGYRQSRFKPPGQPWLITAVTFRLPRHWQPRLTYPDLARRFEAAAPSPAGVADAVIAIRRDKLPDPAELGNAGSFFHNPIVDADQFARLAAQFGPLPHYRQDDGRIKLAAGWLIEQCGWKGRRLGPVGCHARQALVLVNLGGARLADVLALAEAIRADVQARFGVGLQIEPAIVGQRTPYPDEAAGSRVTST